MVRFEDTGEPAFARITVLSGAAVIKRTIASLWDEPPVSEYHNCEVTFDQDDLDSIDDYTDMRIRVEACLGCCFYIHYPLSLRARFVNVSGCEALGGMEIPLVYDADVGQYWHGVLGDSSSSSSSSSGCDHADFDLELWCQPEGAQEWALLIYCDCGQFCTCDAYMSETSLNCDCQADECDPFELTFHFDSGWQFYGGCSCESEGEFTVIIEEDT